MPMSTQLVLAAVGVLLAASASAQPVPADASMRVTLLGTGSPPPILQRFGPATLIEAGGQTLLVDAGRGVTQRLWQVKVPLGKVDVLFLTHLHSDHVVGIPDLWLTGWLTSPFGKRPGPMRVIGPGGTRNLMSGLEKAFEWDVRTRIADQKLPEPGVAVDVTEIAKEGVVYEREGLRVTAFEVDHGPLIKPAFGYRVDYGPRSAVISGDTRFSENLIGHARGADLLIHQVAMARPELLQEGASWQVILDHHTRPEEAGTVFARVKPKLAVYYHLVLLASLQTPPPTLKELEAATRKTYDGPLVLGEDLMSFTVGPGGVEAAKRP
jgi:ribonuclease Z